MFLGAYHTDDLHYFFGDRFMFGQPAYDSSNPDDVTVLTAMTTAWTNFAKYG